MNVPHATDGTPLRVIIGETIVTAVARQTDGFSSRIERLQ